MRGRCDTFVVKTNVHYPTDINLLFDAVRKSIELISSLSLKHNLTTWRQSRYNIKKVKRFYRKAQKSKYGNVKQNRINKAHNQYIILCTEYLNRVKTTIVELGNNLSLLDVAQIEVIKKYIAHGDRQINQIKRRVLQEEKIPHNEKVFSLFEPHTEWICKGKMGVPVELGLRVCIMEEQNQFILHHKVMQKQTDEKVAVSMVQETKKRFPNFTSTSYDRGFFSKENRRKLEQELTDVALPKKGRLSLQDRDIENTESFRKAKHKHSAVESAINSLGVHGLDICLDHGLQGFLRYVSLAIIAQNIYRIGSIILKRKQRLMALSYARIKRRAA